MPNIFRDHFARCAERGDVATFGAVLRTATEPSSHAVIRRFLALITHPFAEILSQELDAPTVHSAEVAPKVTVLSSVGRFWPHESGADILVEPDGWQSAFALAETAIGQRPLRSLLVCGEPLVGKSSFLRLFAQRLRHEGWSVFEASGTDLQADQVYIGELEGRIRQVIDELARTHKTIWYIPGAGGDERAPPGSERDHPRPDRAGNRRRTPGCVRRDDAQGPCAADADQAVAARPFRDHHHRAVARQ